jgi:hypothetical protein
VGPLVAATQASLAGFQMAVFELLSRAGSTKEATRSAAAAAVKDSADGTPFEVGA